jgi:hypothetical protein
MQAQYGNQRVTMKGNEVGGGEGEGLEEVEDSPKVLSRTEGLMEKVKLNW